MNLIPIEKYDCNHPFLGTKNSLPTVNAQPNINLTYLVLNNRAPIR